MIQDIDLRELSGHEAPDRVFLSVYVGGEAGAQAIEHRLNSLRAVLEDGNEERELEHFDENARMVREWLQGQPTATGTTCVFACYALDLLRGYHLDLELATDVRIGVAPFVRPLAELQDEYQTFAIVAADNHTTRIFLVTAQHSEVADQVSGGVKNHVRKGGWSQKRYQRRRDDQLQHYARDVAEHLAELSGRESFERIVLLGSDETLIAIEEELHPELTSRVVARDSADLKAGEAALIEAAFEHYFAAEREAERALWQHIQDEYKSGGLAAVGGADVLGAVSTGRADAIVVERDAALPGRRCSECENSFEGEPERCPICRSDVMAEIDLVNELTRQAEATGARVEYADTISGLNRVGGVAALLRY